MALRGIAALLVVLTVLPPTAWAQTRDKKAAAAHFQSGRALFEAGRWSEALIEFEQGYDAFPLPGFLVNIGQCYRKLERLEEARDTWQKFLDGNPSDPRLRAEVEEALVEVRGEIQKRAELERAEKQKEEEKQRLAAESIARQQMIEQSSATAPTIDLTVHSLPADTAVTAERPHKKSRWWVWTLVGVVAAGAVASAVAVGVVYGQPSAPQPGSLGLLDGRR